jgi:hypothetical protein
VVVTSYGRIAALAGHGLDGGPAHEARALFGDVAPTDLFVGLVMSWGEPGPAA